MRVEAQRAGAIRAPVAPARLDVEAGRGLVGLRRGLVVGFVGGLVLVFGRWAVVVRREPALGGKELHEQGVDEQGVDEQGLDVTQPLGLGFGIEEALVEPEQRLAAMTGYRVVRR